MYINFERTMNNAEKELKENPINYIYMANDIERAKKYIKQFIDTHPELQAEHIKPAIIDYLYKQTAEFAELSDLTSDIYERAAINELAKRGNQYIRDVYDSLKDEELQEEDMITANNEQNMIAIIKRALMVIRESEENMDEAEKEIIRKYLKGDKNAQKAINGLISTCPKADAKRYKMRIESVRKGEKEFLLDFLAEYKTVQSQELKARYIKLLKFIGEYLKQMDLLTQYAQWHNTALEKSNLKQLAHTGMDYYEEIFEADFLQTLDIDDLEMLVVFWINRFTKESDVLNNGIFAILSSDSEIKIKENINPEFSQEELKEFYKKLKLLDIVSKQITDSAIERVLNTHEDSNGTIMVEDEIAEVENLIAHKYTEEFSKKDCKNDYNLFYDNIRLFIPLTSNTTNSYRQKDAILTTQIQKFMSSKKIKNWGLLDVTNKDIVIGIDYEGFNRPIGLHMKKSYLIDFLSVNGLKPIIPIYKGKDDMYIKTQGKYGMTKKQRINCHVLRPMTIEDKKNIREMLSSGKYSGDSLKFIEHLRFLANSKKFPTHLLKTTVGANGETSLAIPETQYYDLATDIIYEKNDAGEYVKVGDENNGTDGRAD